MCTPKNLSYIHSAHVQILALVFSWWCVIKSGFKKYLYLFNDRNQRLIPYHKKTTTIVVIFWSAKVYIKFCETRWTITPSTTTANNSTVFTIFSCNIDLEYISFPGENLFNKSNHLGKRLYRSISNNGSFLDAVEIYGEHQCYPRCNTYSRGG